MGRDLYDFTWPVPSGGIAWQEVATARGPLWLLTEGKAWTPGRRFYEPLKDYSGLFRVFAFTPPDRDSILAFANRFGRLGCEQMYDSAELGPRPKRGQFISFEGEPLEDWVTQIRTMRRLVRLWDLCLASDLAGLSTLIRWDGDPPAEVEVRYRCGGGLEVEPELDPLAPPVTDLIASATFHPERLQGLPPGDRYGPALAHLEQELNKQLGQVPVHLLWDRKAGRLRRKIRPASLKSALWLQFAEASLLLGLLSFCLFVPGLVGLTNGTATVRWTSPRTGANAG
jgi:hypothetical protein